MQLEILSTTGMNGRITALDYAMDVNFTSILPHVVTSLNSIDPVTGYPMTTELTVVANSFSYTGAVAAVPEPTSVLLVAPALLGFTVLKRRGAFRPWKRA